MKVETLLFDMGQPKTIFVILSCKNKLSPAIFGKAKISKAYYEKTLRNDVISHECRQVGLSIPKSVSSVVKEVIHLIKLGNGS